MANRFFLLPVVTIPLDDGNISLAPKYLKTLRNPAGYPCRFAASRYGRDDIWLVRVMDISDPDLASLSAQPDVYTFPVDQSLDSPFSDRSQANAFFESFRIPTDWTTPSTTYREFLRSLVNMAKITQRFFGYTQTELFNLYDLSARFRDLDANSQIALRLAIESLAGQAVTINQNNTLRQLMRSGSNLLQNIPTTLGDITL